MHNIITLSESQVKLYITPVPTEAPNEDFIVVLHDPRFNREIKYTTNGLDPITSGSIFSDPIEITRDINNSTTLRLSFFDHVTDTYEVFDGVYTFEPEIIYNNLIDISSSLNPIASNPLLNIQSWFLGLPISIDYVDNIESINDHIKSNIILDVESVLTEVKFGNITAEGVCEIESLLNVISSTSYISESILNTDGFTYISNIPVNDIESGFSYINYNITDDIESILDESSLPYISAIFPCCKGIESILQHINITNINDIESALEEFNVPDLSGNNLITEFTLDLISTEDGNDLLITE